MKKKKAPVDSTMRNVRAANKRIKELELELKRIMIICVKHEFRISILEKKRGKK